METVFKILQEESVSNNYLRTSSIHWNNLMSELEMLIFKGNKPISEIEFITGLWKEECVKQHYSHISESSAMLHWNY